MKNRAVFLLLGALAARAQAAVPVEFQVLSEAPVAPSPASLAAPSALFLPAAVVPAAERPTDARLAALFEAARPDSPAVEILSRQEGGFGAAAGRIVDRYTFQMEHLLKGMRAAPELVFDPEGRRVLKATEDLVSVVDSRDGPAARSFLQALGRRHAEDYVARPGDKTARRYMPRNELGSGDYWDMAAGMNADHFIMNELEPGTRYSFFDVSPFVVSYLNAVAAHKGADASAIEADILKLKRPERPLAVLRTKNAVVYVPGFEKKLAEMADWIAPGGRLVIQNDPQAGERRPIVRKHAGLLVRLIKEGWDFAFEFASSRTAEHALDTLIFTRPKGAAPARSEEETRTAWSSYLAAVNYADARGR